MKKHHVLKSILDGYFFQLVLSQIKTIEYLPMEIRPEIRKSGQVSVDYAISQIPIICNMLRKEDKIRSEISEEVDFILGAIFGIAHSKFDTRSEKLELMPIASEADLINEHLLNNIKKIREQVINQIGI